MDPATIQPRAIHPNTRANLFDSTRAKAAAAKSAESRRQTAALRKQVLAPAETVIVDDAVLTARRLQILSSQIAQTHNILTRDKIEHKDRAQLLNALDRLIERERILRGIPAPAHTKANIRTLPVMVQPIIAPQPATRQPAQALPEVGTDPSLPEQAEDLP